MSIYRKVELRVKITFCELYERIKNLKAADDKKKEELTYELLLIENQIKEGDFVITPDSFRMNGYYYYDGYNFLKNYSNYGYCIREEAYQMVKKHGVIFFDELNGTGFIKILESEIEQEKDNGPFYIYL